MKNTHAKIPPLRKPRNRFCQKSVDINSFSRLTPLLIYHSIILCQTMAYVSEFLGVYAKEYVYMSCFDIILIGFKPHHTAYNIYTHY